MTFTTSERTANEKYIFRNKQYRNRKDIIKVLLHCLLSRLNVNIFTKFIVTHPNSRLLHDIFDFLFFAQRCCLAGWWPSWAQRALTNFLCRRKVEHSTVSGAQTAHMQKIWQCQKANKRFEKSKNENLISSKEWEWPKQLVPRVSCGSIFFGRIFFRMISVGALTYDELSKC